MAFIAHMQPKQRRDANDNGYWYENNNEMVRLRQSLFNALRFEEQRKLVNLKSKPHIASYGRIYKHTGRNERDAIVQS